MKKVIYTIGYAHQTQESFLKSLLKYHINCVVDIRTLPYSGFHAQFNREPIKDYLKIHGISYIHMDEAFGIIKDRDDLLDESGYIDFKKLAQEPAFLVGVKRIEEGLKKGYVICFMCAEKDPVNCHRSTLVGRAFYDMGYQVAHILYDGEIEWHEELEKRMTTLYCPDEPQLHLFVAQPSEKERQARAYDACSQDIFVVNAKRVLKDDYDYPRR